MKTTFAGKTNPFTGKDKVVSVLEICNDPLPGHRLLKSKYEEIFEILKPGQAIKCPGEETGKVSAALRAYLKRSKKKNLVRCSSHYAKQEPTGRVWLV